METDDGIYQVLVESQLLFFYGVWQLAACFFAFGALMAIWWHIGRRQGDTGQVWLALSVLCWSCSGGVEVFFAQQLRVAGIAAFQQQPDRPGAREDTWLPPEEPVGQPAVYEQQLSHQLNGWRSILSLFNSLFILLALPWFRYIPKRIELIVKSKYWPFIVGLPFLFSLLPTASKLLFGQSYGLISELDVYYAILTLCFLGLVLWESFFRRRLIILAWLSLACILVTFVAQLYKLTASDIDLNLFSAIFKTSLIMMFFALALSWVKELAENVIPGPENIFLSFERHKKGRDKFEHRVRFRGIPGKGDLTIVLTPALFDLFLKFARNKFAEGDDWLEIKPKNDDRSAKNYDIKDYNEIRRLLSAILDGLFGKGSWTKNLHEQPLKTALFEMSEKRDRKIRLRLPVENIRLSKELIASSF